MRKSVLKRMANTNPIRAKKVLKRVLARITLSGGKNAGSLDQEEAALIQCLGSYVKGGPLFTEDDLFKDFARFLGKQKLLLSSEVSTLKKVSAAISLFALTAMHNRVLDMGDGTEAKVAITADPNGNLAVYAHSKFPGINLAPTTVYAWIFSTSLPIADYCEPGVAPPGRIAFDGAFEMTTEIKLARLA